MKEKEIEYYRKGHGNRLENCKGVIMDKVMSLRNRDLYTSSTSICSITEYLVLNENGELNLVEPRLIIRINQ